MALSWGYGPAWIRTKTDSPSLALTALLSSGAANNSAEEIAKYEALHGLTITASATERTLQLLGAGTIEDGGLQRLLLHMQMYWMHHKYDPAVFKRIRLALLMATEQQDRKIETSTLNALYDVAFKGDPRFTTRSFEDINAMQPHNLTEVALLLCGTRRPRVMLRGPHRPDAGVKGGGKGGLTSQARYATRAGGGGGGIPQFPWVRLSAPAPGGPVGRGGGGFGAVIIHTESVPDSEGI